MTLIFKKLSHILGDDSSLISCDNIGKNNFVTATYSMVKDQMYVLLLLTGNKMYVYF
jgi:hypothetical protein